MDPYSVSLYAINLQHPRNHYHASTNRTDKLPLHAIQYDTSVYLTCSKTLMGSQLSYHTE